MIVFPCLIFQDKLTTNKPVSKLNHKAVETTIEYFWFKIEEGERRDIQEEKSQKKNVVKDEKNVAKEKNVVKEESKPFDFISIQCVLKVQLLNP